MATADSPTVDRFANGRGAHIEVVIKGRKKPGDLVCPKVTDDIHVHGGSNRTVKRAGYTSADVMTDAQFLKRCGDRGQGRDDVVGVTHHACPRASGRRWQRVVRHTPIASSGRGSRRRWPMGSGVEGPPSQADARDW